MPEAKLRSLRPVPKRIRRALIWLRFVRVRERVARRYLRGAGLEIGALNLPLRVPSDVTVTYVDRWPLAELRRQTPQLAAEIVAPDVIDDATTLATIQDCSQDFVVANHFLEHCEDTISALATMLRVTKPGGIVFLTVPDKRRTFDRRRELTSFEHLLRDHELGPKASRAAHYEEWARLVVGVDEQEVAAYVAARLREHGHIHFHVWTHATLLEHLRALAARLGFELVETRRNVHESVVVLRRR